MKAAMQRLSRATLPQLPADVARPAGPPPTTGVVHLGIGAFHRAHQAAVFDQALRSGDARWGVIGASLRSPGVRDQMVPQDGLYTLVERDGGDERLRVIGAVHDVIVAPDDPDRLTAALSHPDVHLVTLTITEKGYLPGGSAASVLVRALAARRARGLAPFTAMSCDNLSGNGRVLERAVLALAAHDGGLHDWIAGQGAFPDAMVDRIVPATTDADIARLAERLGVEDRAMVKTEPFRQWVIEDRFCGPRPAFEDLGVQVVAHVAPWENAKLRLLNGAHSALAYLGAPAGAAFVDQAARRPGFARYVEALWAEARATLPPTPGLDLDAYCASLMARFTNPALEHRTHQIAMDGSQKLPQRLVASIRERRAMGLESPALTLAVAAWMRWQLGHDEQGTAFRVDDPLAQRTAALLEGAIDAATMADALLSLREIFGDLHEDERFRAEVSGALAALLERGADAAVAGVAA